MVGRIIREREALALAGELARTDPISYGRFASILARCRTVNTEGIPFEEETVEQTIKRVAAEQMASFRLPDGARPKEVRLVVTYDGLMASIEIRLPGEKQEQEGT